MDARKSQYSNLEGDHISIQVKWTDEMRISIVVPYFTPFYKQNEYGLCRSLADLGHEVWLLTSNRKMKKFYHEASERGLGGRVEQDLEGFKAIYLPTLIDWFEQPLMPSIGREIRSLDSEVVHVHEDFQNCSSLASRAAREIATPTVLSEERYYLPGGFWRFPYFLYSSTFAKSVRGGAAAITAHSNAAKEFLVSLGTERERVEVIPVGIDPDEFKPSDEETLSRKVRVGGERVILTVARLHPNKGLTYLLQAMPHIIDEYYESRLIIIGRGPLEDQIRGLIHQLNIENNVVLLTEPIPNEEMSKIYPGCDIFVLPSVKEPFGRVVLEAMACGRPVVATKVGGLPDIVEDGKTGYLVDSTDPGQLAARVNDLLRDRKMMRGFGRAGRKRVLEKFDWKKIAKRYIEIYESVPGKTGK